MIRDVLAVVGMVGGAVCVTVAALGIVRLSDTLARAHALGLAATMGVLLGMLGVTLALGDLGSGGKALLTVLFVFLTSPVGSHMLGRAAYRFGLRPIGLKIDEYGQAEGTEEEPPPRWRPRRRP